MRMNNAERVIEYELKDYLKSGSVWLRTALHAAISGAASAITMHYTDPTQFDFSPAGIHRLEIVAIGGAALAVIHLFLSRPTP